LEQIKQLNLHTERDYIVSSTPRNYASRDSTAMFQGLKIPPHISILAKVAALQSPTVANRNLASFVQKAAAHIERLERKMMTVQPFQSRGTRVFIGHGHSNLWKDLKDFLQDRLKLEWDEFNRVPIAGTTNITRLSQMLDSASIAFLVMTGEDEHADKKVGARMNVIHEVGLFQGRLGFTKAIVLMEEGCEEFSNIQGLGQIRFPNSNISASFEEIRRVLEREEIIKL
jgi:predicted nucleotide-binding protein